MPANAGGFCVYNDVAVAIAWLLDQVSSELVTLTWTHHGDGVQEIFYNDPRVMTVSLHESSRDSEPFPGSRATARSVDPVRSGRRSISRYQRA